VVLTKTLLFAIADSEAWVGTIIFQRPRLIEQSMAGGRIFFN